MGGNPSVADHDSDDEEISTAYSNKSKKKKKKGGKKKKRRFYDSSLYKFDVFPDIKNIEKLDNYGIIPVEVLHNILIFLPVEDHLNATLTSKLFLLVGNTVFFWKAYCENVIGSEDCKLHKEEYDKREKDVNWKLFYFHKARVKTNQFYIDRYKKHGWNDGIQPKELCPHKIVVLGKDGAGKSSLVLRFVRNQYYPQQESTIGAAFLTMEIGPYKYEIWDTAGADRYESLLPMYYRGASLVFLTFSLTDRQKFDDMKKSLLPVFKRTGDGALYRERVVLVGCKNDLVEQRKIFRDEAMKIVEELGFISYVECSAKDTENVYKVFGVGAEYLEEVHGTEKKKDDDEDT